MATYKLLGLSGALRKESTNSKLLREAGRLFGDCAFEEGNLHLPLYDGDAEEADGIPAEVAALADQIRSADAIVISTPEYNKGPSGVLKNALDWVSRTEGNPWKGKPVAVMSAAAGRAGGERAQMILRGFMCRSSRASFKAQRCILRAVAMRLTKMGIWPRTCMSKRLQC